MPRFLISDRFMKLENGTRERRGSSSNVIDMSSILSETKMQVRRAKRSEQRTL